MCPYFWDFIFLCCGSIQPQYRTINQALIIVQEGFIPWIEHISINVSVKKAGSTPAWFPLEEVNLLSSFTNSEVNLSKLDI